MKKILIVFLLFVLCVAASVTTTTMIVKPAAPIKTIIVRVDDGDHKTVDNFLKAGYQIKAVTGSTYNWCYTVFLEKYE